MNERSQNPLGRTSRTSSRASTGNGAFTVLPERHLQAYLLARETVRRVQRTASLLDRSRDKSAPPS